MAIPGLAVGISKAARKTAGAFRVGAGGSGCRYVVTDRAGYIPVPGCPVRVKAGTLPVCRVGLGRRMAGRASGRSKPPVEINGARRAVTSLAVFQIRFRQRPVQSRVCKGKRMRCSYPRASCVARPRLPIAIGEAGRKAAGAFRVGAGGSGCRYVVTDRAGYIPVPGCPVRVKAGTLPVCRMGLGGQMAGRTSGRSKPPVEINGARRAVTGLAEAQVCFRRGSMQGRIFKGNRMG